MESLKLMHQIKSHLRENFPYRRPVSEEGLMMGASLVMFKVILKCLNACEKTFPTFLRCSIILL